MPDEDQARPRATRSTPDKRISANVAAARKAADLTQIEVANAMNARGHKFRQQTVQKIESATRSVGYEEAEDLADILQANILEGSDAAAVTTAVVQKFMLTQARADLEKIRGAVDSVESTLRSLQTQMDITIEKRSEDGPAS